MSIHLSMNVLRTMLAAMSDVTLTPATDEAVKRVRKAGAPKELLEMYRVGMPDAAYVEMNGVRLYSIDGALEENARTTIDRDGYFVFASSADGAYFCISNRSQTEDRPRPIVKFERLEVASSAPRIVSPSLDAFVFAFATNALK